MEPTILEDWIKHLGTRYDFLVENKIIPELPLKALYQDSDTLEIEPEAGVELVFSESEYLEMIQISLGKNLGFGLPIYSGELPAPYYFVTKQTCVHAHFGNPLLYSYEQVRMPGTLITMGGWEKYQLPSSLHEAAFVEFQYTKDFRVDRIIFELMERD